MIKVIYSVRLTHVGSVQRPPRVAGHVRAHDARLAEARVLSLLLVFFLFIAHGGNKLKKGKRIKRNCQIIRLLKNKTQGPVMA